MLVITDLPDVMERKENWAVAAGCMRRWFAGKAKVMSIDIKRGKARMDSLADDMLAVDLLSMKWALGFTRVSMAYQTLITQKWNNPAAVIQMGVRVRAQMAAGAGANVKKGQPWRFGDLAKAAKTVDNVSQINFTVVGDIQDPLDDFYGAVGKATLNVAVEGFVVSASSGQLQLTIDTLGVYLRDTYDFIGDQALGVWSEKGVDRSRLDELLGMYTSHYPPIAIADQASPGAPKDDPNNRYSVSNADFNRYRNKFGKGGDFINVSDVKIMKLPSAQSFALP